MNKEERLLKLEKDMETILKFLPDVELWLRVLAEQFKLNRAFIKSLDNPPVNSSAKMDASTATAADVPVTPTAQQPVENPGNSTIDNQAVSEASKAESSIPGV